MESWRLVFRDGIAPLLTLDSLHALSAGLAGNDACLSQGATTEPPPSAETRDWHIESADAIVYAGWKGGALPHPALIESGEEYFARVCFECDQRLGEPAACCWFLNWWDETPRAEAFGLLLAEVTREIALRQQQPTSEPASV